MKTVFVLKDEKLKFPSMLQVAKHLGKSRIYRKDFERFNIEEMTEEEFETFLVTEDKDELSETVTVEEVAEEIVEPSVTESIEEVESKNDETPENASEDVEDIEIPSFNDIVEFSEVMKSLGGKKIVALAKKLDLEWTEHEKLSVQTMRASIALRKHFFPGQRRPKRKKSPWKRIPYQDLKKLALENNLTWTETEDERINRMWVINALKRAGVEAPPKK